MAKNSQSMDEELAEVVATFRSTFSLVENSLHTVIVGNHDIIRCTLASIFAGGHVLLEGVPGLGKTLLIKSVAKALGLSFKRIQFTPDLMPSDITGTQILSEDENGFRGFEFRPGPLFANVVLADEINRATPKAQSALLEAMEEHQVTVFDQTFTLPTPFFVLATQNPIELEGTYPLPEAQLDRFMVKLLVKSPSSQDLREVLQRTTGAAALTIEPVLNEDESADIISHMRNIVRQVYVAQPLLEVIVRIMEALTPASSYATELVKRYVRYGPGPRGAQALLLAGKVFALLDERVNLSFEDVKSVLFPALRHRLILNFQAEADNVSAEDILGEVKAAK